MNSSGTPTYDQLRIFLTVAETGSFAAAGRKLNRATSVVSYGIANLEAQLGIQLFDRKGTRKPVLTPAGRSVLSEARTIAHGMDGLRAKVNGLLQGLEPEVSLAVDVMLPSAHLARALNMFAQQFPTVTLRLHVEALGAVTALVMSGKASIGISGPLSMDLKEIEQISLGSVPLIPVASPTHPLAAGPQQPGAGRDHLQLVLTDRSPLTEGQDFSVVGDRTWRLADLGAKHMLLREGIGWGNMPQPLIEADLMAGTLMRLDMPDHIGAIYPLLGIHRSDTPPGPAASWLLRWFADNPVSG
jgi:DNA-binding transcriptional LysR family regulator